MPSEKFGLVKKRYPAAFDNTGWLFYTRHNIPEAVNHFRMGAQLGDPDLMVSLVEMYDRGHARPRSQDEVKVALLERAARLGHAGAARNSRLNKKGICRWSSKGLLSRSRQKRVIEMFGGFIQGMQHR